MTRRLLAVAMLALIPTVASVPAEAHRRSRPPRSTRPPRSARPAAPPTPENFARLRQCEAGGDYANKRNPRYRGAYQFAWRTWAGVGGEGDPADAPPEEQDERARILQERSGWGQWPACSRKLGLR